MATKKETPASVGYFNKKMLAILEKDTPKTTKESKPKKSGKK